MGIKHQQQIVRCTGCSLELWTFDKKTGVLTKVKDQNVYSNMRHAQLIRPAGMEKDCLALTSDSGDLSIVEFDHDSFTFKRLTSLPLFKTGIRVRSPGEYVSADRHGRSIVVAAVEKNRFVFTCHVISGHVTLSSPIEASRSGLITFFLCELDVGFEDPVFACIEAEAGAAPKKRLAYYELDLGINHVVQKYTEDLPETATFLISVPGGIDGPSGLLVCSDGMVQYRCLSKMTHQVPIPRRETQSTPSRIVSGTVHVLKKSFIILLQTELGDIFKVTVHGKPQDSDESDGQPGMVDSITISYFDTVPVCSSMLVFRSGFLFANCESGDQQLYQFEALGDSDGWKSTDYPDDIAALGASCTFKPRDLTNLNLVYILEDLNPVISATLTHPKMDLPVILSLCGSGARSSLKILDHELPVTELATQELPTKARAVFTCRTGEFDKYIVISFYDETLVLEVGEDVEEAENSGMITDSSTLAVGQVGSSILQVTSNEMRQVGSISWKPPIGIEILHCSMTPTQAVLALSSRELVYFELDADDKLVECGERREMGSQITSLCLGKPRDGQLRFPYILVGGRNQTLTILHAESGMKVVNEENLSSVPTSLLVFEMDSLYAHIGMENGVYARLRMDPITGELTNPRNQYLGPKSVTLSMLHINNQDVVAACSTRTYIGYTSATDLAITALSKPTFDAICGFYSHDVPEDGAIGVAGDSLTIFTIDQLDSSLLIESIPLRYTPKDMTTGEMIYVAEADNDTVSPYKKGVSYEDDEDNYQQFGYDRKDGQWASCVQVVSVANKAVGQTIELDGEAAFKLAQVHISGQKYVVVSTATAQQFMPNRSKETYLRTYRVESDGSLSFVHKTQTQHLALALCEFQGKLLVGMGNLLCLYDLGTKQLLKKCTGELGCREIVDLQARGSEVFVSDANDGARLVCYRSASNSFESVVDDTISRHVTRSLTLDKNTIAVGDRFGEISVLRCPKESQSFLDGFQGKLEGKFNGSAFRFETLVSFYVGDVITSLRKGSLSIGGDEYILYSGLQGTIGCLRPLKTVKDVNFFRELQKQVSSELPTLTGREWLKYRGYYIPVKGCIDGDLLEEYLGMSWEKRSRIAKKMEREPREIDRRVAEMRR